MGTHPIFESDFDCLTDFQTRFGLRLKICVTSLIIFLLNSAEMMPHQPMTSKPSSPASVLMLMKKRNQKPKVTPETTTWDSAFSTKKWKTRTHTEQRSSWILNCTIIYLCTSVQSIRKKHSEKGVK